MGYLALIGRILLLGYERIIVKQLGEDMDPVASTFLFFVIGSVLLSPLVVFFPWPGSPRFLIFMISASLVYSLAFVLYLRSLSIGEASLVSPLYYFNVFFLLLLAVLFLGESFTWWKVIGMLLLVWGTSYLHRQGNVVQSLRALLGDRACQLMIVASMLIAIGRTVDAAQVQAVHPAIYACLLYAAISLWLLIYLVLRRRLLRIGEVIRARPRQAIIAGVVNGYSYMLLLVAFRTIEVSAAEPASMLSMIVTVLLAAIVFREKIGWRLLAAGIMLLGVLFLFL